MKERDNYAIRLAFAVVVTGLTYAVQFLHCLVPAQVLYEMMMEARTGVVQNVSARLCTIAIGGFFFVMIGWYRRVFLFREGANGGKAGTAGKADSGDRREDQG